MKGCVDGESSCPDPYVFYDINQDVKCVSECSHFTYDSTRTQRFQCHTVCPEGYKFEVQIKQSVFCNNSCPDNMPYSFNNVCVNVCPSGTFLNTDSNGNTKNTCGECDEPLYRHSDNTCSSVSHYHYEDHNIFTNRSVISEEKYVLSGQDYCNKYVTESDGALVCDDTCSNSYNGYEYRTLDLNNRMFTFK